MIIKDTFRNKILWHRFVRDESVSGYLEGIEWLRANGFSIYSIVCDGMRGLFPALKTYRLQMCQYHMIQIARRHLTAKPDLEASVELLAITQSLSRIPKTEFREELSAWHENGGTSSRRKASVQMAECISHTRVQGPHPGLSGSICLTSGLLNTIRNSVYRIQMPQ